MKGVDEFLIDLIDKRQSAFDELNAIKQLTRIMPAVGLQPTRRVHYYETTTHNREEPLLLTL